MRRRDRRFTTGVLMSRLYLRASLVAVAAMLAPVIPPPAAIAASAPKVVIIVGPVGGATDSYRSDADAAAVAAAKYTSNVVKIYSPNATWDLVKSALQGASIVIYMGHGNGFPSPYTTTLQADRQDGLGVNPTAGADDSTTTYWGEQYLASDVRLASNAVVLLGHLCYASGNSEPGNADPSLTVAEQRVDNFGAGFIAAGARAVIAEAYNGSAASYIDALFSAHDTLGNIWANAPSQQGNPSSFASTRSPGMTGQVDPDHSSGKYHRSIVGDLTLPSDAVVAGTASAPAPGPTATANPSPSPTPSPSSAPAATSPPAAASAETPGTIGSVPWTTTTVRLRARPTTRSRTLVILPPNTAVRLLGSASDADGRTWYRVRVHSRTGWLAAWLTRSTRAEPAATPTGPPAATWQTARASSFGVDDGLLGQPMACGGVLTDSVMAVAHLTLPCGTHLRLRYAGQVVDAQVLERGPYVAGITFDLAPAVCHALGDCRLLTLEWQLVP